MDRMHRMKAEALLYLYPASPVYPCSNLLWVFCCLALLLSGGAQVGARREAPTYGPYHGSFIAGGLGLKKPLKPEDSPVAANSSWAMYYWIKSDAPIMNGTVLAGFGDPLGEPGSQRYFVVQQANRISFWTGSSTLFMETKITPGRWQFLAATFEQGELAVYVDGVQLSSDKGWLLYPAAPVIHLAPVALPWRHAEHFAGKIAGFTLVPRSLSPGEIRALMAQAPSLDELVFEPGSKSWPVQTKGQNGLQAPQEPATLPKSSAELPQPAPVPARDNRPELAPRGPTEWAIAGGWRLREALKGEEDGSVVSRAGFKTDGWLDATVPGTVLTTLVERGIYPDPDYGLNNLSIPETLNKQAYWYRTEFTPPLRLKGRRFTITLHGINYSAQVWLNGKPLGETRGAFTRGQFDASKLVIPGRPNALAVRVSPPPHPGIPHEQSIKAGPGPNGGALCLDGPTFICTEGWDWIPAVRDRNTGIWQEVTLRATGPVTIGDTQVVTRLPLPDTSRAQVTLTVPLRNDSARPAAGILEASFEGVTVRRSLTVAPGEAEVRLSPADFPQLNIMGPRLWWPNGYGRPELYHLRVRFTTAAGESDSKSLRFGIRELTYELTLLDREGRLRRVEYSPAVASLSSAHVVSVSHKAIVESVEGWVASFMPGGEDSASVRLLQDRRASPFLVIRVNGVRIACKGGNWGLDDSRKRVTRERLEPFFRLHRDANLTMIRNWCGQNSEEVFYELADEYGLLVWNDFWLSTQGWNLEPEDAALFLSNARDTIRRFRNHPSIAIWCGRNEGVPPPVINEGLDDMVRTLDGTRYYTPNSRSINLQDSGPWNYVEPSTLYTRRGLGFTTEIGLPSPPSLDTIRAMMPAGDQWPPSDAWAYHDWHSKGGQEVKAFVKAMEEEMGPPVSLEDFERKAQLMNYTSHRAMFEGFNGRLWNPNTGRLMWMTHPAWPSMVWQMYGSDYSTYAAFYGIKKACEPLHVQLNLPGLEAAVINNTTRRAQNLHLSARVFSAAGQELSAREESVSVEPQTAVESFRVEPPEPSADSLLFIKLMLRDSVGQLLSENFYWHAARPGDYQKLKEMQTATVDCTASRKDEARSVRVTVDLANSSPVIALATEVTLRGAGGRARVLPAYQSDNYISLLPWERRRITVEVPSSAATVGALEVAVKGWNVRAVTVPVESTR
jgi:Glycosyl hydrolase 2 galactose-binding domain-like/Exo-beta-D-glucosaminidase Ig-fold domain/Concanavalin A-like lectin/glucanases superfamily/Glycosyl hydrolases family 2/Glycosyl hydrolases family 2, TIM barrel domain